MILRKGIECFNCLLPIPDDDKVFTISDPDDMYGTVPICEGCNSDIKELAEDPETRDSPVVEAWLETVENQELSH
jgi:hypothetical protein